MLPGGGRQVDADALAFPVIRCALGQVAIFALGQVAIFALGQVAIFEQN